MANIMLAFQASIGRAKNINFTLYRMGHWMCTPILSLSSALGGKSFNATPRPLYHRERDRVRIV